MTDTRTDLQKLTGEVKLLAQEVRLGHERTNEKLEELRAERATAELKTATLEKDVTQLRLDVVDGFGKIRLKFLAAIAGVALLSTGAGAGLTRVLGLF